MSAKGRNVGITMRKALSLPFHCIKRLGEEAITELVVGFIALAIIIGVGVTILSSVGTATQSAMANVQNADYMTLYNTTSTTSVSGMGLMVIVLIIVAAAAIMGAVYLIQRR